MSASERLAALHPFGWYEAQTQDGRTLRLVPSEIVDALPEIVAVVKAAEETDASVDPDDPRGWVPLKALTTALAALEEKLGEP